MRLLISALVLSAALPAAAEPLPADAGVVDVRDYGAKGDGVHDDTAALLKAIAASGTDTGRTFWQDRPVYLPDGTYLVSDTLLKRYADGRFASGLFLMGQSRAHTVIRLADHAPGFDDPRRPRAVVFTTSKHIDGTPTSGGKDYPGLGEGNDAYMNFVEDLTVDIGHGNPGAIGIDYLANNLGAIRNVSLTAGEDSGAVGLSMTRKWPGPALIRNLSIQGFDTGIATAQTEYGLTFDHIRLTDQRAAAIRNDQNALAIRDLDVQGPAPAIVNGGEKGFVAVEGGTLHSGVVGAAGVIVGRDLSAPEGGWKPAAVPGWAPKPFDIAPPPELPPARWASVAKYGAAPDSPQAMTAGLRHALASGEATVYLPHGTYLIDDTVEIPATVRRIVGMNSTIRVAPNRQPGFSRTAGMLRIASAGESLTIENLAFDNTSQGAQLAVEVSGGRDVVLRDIVSAGVELLNRREGGGRVRLENVCCGRMEIAGPQPVEALQFDTEGGGTRIVNRGSPLSILGLKTEGISTIVDNRDGARTDIFGGLIYMVRDPQGAPPPAFQSSGSYLSAAFAEEVLKPGNQYRVYLSHEGRAIEAKDFPERGPGRFVTSLSAGPATPPTQ
jgi:hypothetical protein